MLQIKKAFLEDNMNNREKTRKIFVNGVQIGGENKVIIQSMTNIKNKVV